MITLFTGPMFSSKSTQLFYAMEKAVYGNRKIAFIRPKLDSRKYVAHSIVDKGFNKFIKDKKADLFVIKEFTYKEIAELLNYDEIFVDEYFLIKNNKLLCQSILLNQRLYFAGLISTSENELFEEAAKILPLCDKIKKFNGVCQICNSFHGSYSIFKGNKTDSIVIGDEDKYICGCRECYIKEKGSL